MKIFRILKLLCLSTLLITACMGPLKNEGQASKIKGALFYAQKSFEKDFELTWNDIESHCMISKSFDTNNGLLYKTNYIEIYESASDTIVYKDKFIKSQISWISDTEIKILQLPGRPTGRPRANEGSKDTNSKVKKYILTLPDFKKSLLK